ncbi:tetratricopeptide repeat protein [Haliangium ochraceum]|uniref:Tetratricopeptide repeat protein n=1 Tax=Haliangium ochraceum (strain DSM 14365 / JCM 11303 / SMP-2) TaxID=502025 RepID=D0LU36_HALO1|nr:tetratricopeptide repeat protein [Haliangium ochraceum]ACY17400.1 hypothetical protein Hoch_4911 [Haliangium ochraceum DSM 14365]
MANRPEDALWSRVDNGLHTVVIGGLPEPAPSARNLIRIACDLPQHSLGPVFEALREVEHLMGGSPLVEQARRAQHWVVVGLRQRMLGEHPESGPEAELVEACNRLLQHTEQPYALVFEALEAADENTVDLLVRMLQRPGWMRMPLVLGFRERHDEMPAARLIEVLHGLEGDDAVLSWEKPARAANTATPQPPDTWSNLPADVLQVLRAGATVGTGFEAELVAALLDLEALDVYDHLQRAYDLGVPLKDRGEGRFFLPKSWAESLRASLLPSVLAVWHRRLGMLLAGLSMEAGEEADGEDNFGPLYRIPQTPNPADFDGAEPMPFEQGGAAAGSSDVLDGDGTPSFAHMFDEPDDDGASHTASVTRIHPRRRDDGAALDEGASEAGASATERGASAAERGATGEERGADLGGTMDNVVFGVFSHASPDSRTRGREEEPARVNVSAPPTRRQPLHDPARAAEHLSAAGDVEAAAKRYMLAAGQAASLGAYGQAMEHVRKSLSLIDRLPSTPARRRFRIQTLVTLARLQAQAASPNPELNSAFTLSSALDTVDAALAALRSDDPPELHADARSMAASICYDLGDAASLTRALQELDRASAMHLEAGDEVAAARLLNDQAAVYVRLGDPGRASLLLAKSQQIFESRADSDPVTMIELAETHHLLASLPFHARIRSGHEADALAMGIEHARLAERWYRELGANRELARVWETIGRLELQRRDHERAGEHLSRALQVQNRIGDVTGLARTTAAMAEVLSARGMHRNALVMLSDSIELNIDKGSPIGLAYNRRGYEALRDALANEDSSDLADGLAQVGDRLARAESLLGQVALPDGPFG